LIAELDGFGPTVGHINGKPVFVNFYVVTRRADDTGNLPSDPVV